MKVSEIFHSIQGEGPNIGVPSVFLRLAVCNLTCSWCDSKYTWDWKEYDYGKEVSEVSVDEVVRKIQSYDCKHLVITGGEPMLQQHELSELVEILRRRGYTFEVETNGTILPIQELKDTINQWNVSPKITNSGNSVELREKPEVYKAFGGLPNACFKFVVDSEDDLSEILLLVGKYELPNDRVMLMPQATSEEKLYEKSSWLAEICKKYGFRFTTRLQIVLYGNTRGT
jgi:7-carboxy-7-deazaguanine synthase